MIPIEIEEIRAERPVSIAYWIGSHDKCYAQLKGWWREIFNTEFYWEDCIIKLDRELGANIYMHVLKFWRIDKQIITPAGDDYPVWKITVYRPSNYLL